MDDIRAEVRITGVVQGVGYRAWTRNTARDLGVRGWVRNEPDGSVAAVFVGPRHAVEELLARCDDGPLPAQVDEVTATIGAPRDDEAFASLRIA